MQKRLRLFILLLFVSGSAFPQISFTNNPVRLQLYPRNADDSATVVLSGFVTATQYTDIVFTSSKDGILNDSVSNPLVYTASQAPFNRSYRIRAEKSLHNFRIYLKQGSSYVQALRADSVVCGDVYIINGQSNATANATVSGTDSPYLWVRSFGNPTLTTAIAQADTTWGIAQGNTGSTAYSIGVWGIRLAKMLCDTLNVPVCVINGARPGTPILDHLADADPANINTLYGRLYYRALKAKVNTSVKAIFWYQGENDGAAAVAPLYAGRFNTLRNSWMTHYPNAQKIFVMQTRMGCVDGAPEHRQVREAHRSLGDIYNNVLVMSTVGIPGFDGCHLNVSGYQVLAGFLYKQVSKNLFNKVQPVTANPPNIIKAEFTNSSNTELSVIFNQPVVWPAIFNGHNLKDYFYLNTPVTVVSGSAIGDTVKLILSGTSNAFKVTYLPNQYYNNTMTNYDGPWLMNTAGVGALSFYSFPVSSGLSISASSSTICGAGSVTLTANKSGQLFKWYKNGALISGATAAQYVTNQPGSYYVSITDDNSITVSSDPVSITQGTAGTAPQIVSNTGSFQFCPGGSITLSSNISAPFYQWSTGQTTSSINVSSAQSITLTITDGSGCSATSTPVAVSQHMPVQPQIIASKIVFCQGDSAMLQPDYGTVLQWSTGSVQQQIYLSQTTTVTVSVQGTGGCVVTSSPFTVTKDVPAQPVISGNTALCQGDSLLLTSSNAQAYLWSSSQTTSSIYINAAGTYSVTITDTAGCTATSNPYNVSFYTQPVINISGATQACPGQSIQLTASGGTTYIWSTGATTSTANVTTTGAYTVTGTSSDGCKAVSQPFNVDFSGPAVATSPEGTYYLCSGKRVIITANAPTAVAYQWYKNNNLLGGATALTYSVGSAGTYKVRVTNSNGCTSFSSNIIVTSATTPAASFTVSNQFDVCQDSVVTLTGVSGTQLTYRWQRNSVDIPGGNQQVLNTESKGSYRVIVSSTFGCTKTSSSVSIPVPNPTASVAANGPKTFCAGDSVKLVANAGINYTYQWQKNGANISGATSDSYTAKTTGNYRVRVYNAMGCSATSANVTVNVNNCTGRTILHNNNRITKDINFLVYPNPFKDFVNIEATDDSGDKVIYTVFDITGRLLLTGEFDTENQIVSIVDIEKPGMYVLTLEGTFGKRSYRIQKGADTD